VAAVGRRVARDRSEQRAITGLLALDGVSWDQRVLDVLGLPGAVLTRVVDTIGVVGAPPRSPAAADRRPRRRQQASLVGQGCVAAGRAKVTFGTGHPGRLPRGRQQAGVGAARRETADPSSMVA